MAKRRLGNNMQAPLLIS